LLKDDASSYVGNRRQSGATFEDLRARLAVAMAKVIADVALPVDERVRAGALLGMLGDRRPGVCMLPPAVVAFAGGDFVIGNTPAEIAQIVAEAPDDLRDSVRHWYHDTQNDQPVAITGFALARYPVTNAQFALFIADDGYKPDQPWWNDEAREWLRREGQGAPRMDERFGRVRPNYPVVGVTWYEAVAFCSWLTHRRGYNPKGFTYRLPSEAEWEYAARGPARRQYPWGDAPPDNKRANFDRICMGTTAVGCFSQGATPEGVQDLAGNMWEWTASIYGVYPYDPVSGHTDIHDPSGRRLVIRGGVWFSHPAGIRASVRDHARPELSTDYLGFRLARSLLPVPIPA
jgi:formylglycine-generating enzyme required for sulfatase activity